MRSLRAMILTGGAAAALLLGQLPAMAADITFGSSTEPSAIDPHFSRTGNNQQVAAQIFGRLIDQDANLQVLPGLATSWQAVDPLTWQIKLRPGVVFSDGTPLTPDDVLYSLERVKNIPNSPAPMSGMVGGVASATALDAETIEIKTKTPLPQLMELAGMVYIVKKAAVEGKSLADFNSGAAAIGTGPYKFVEWVPGDRLVLTRNDKYWGRKPDFEKATFKLIGNDAARVAALRSGAVDLIDAVPPNDVPTLTKLDAIKVFSIASSRLIYIAVDSDREQSPFVTDLAGKPLVPNPLKKVEVRRAISKMINRQAIIDRLLLGSGEAAGQQVPEGMGGFVADLKPDQLDLAGAKKLLTDAGYPDGFGLTIHGSNDRFPADGELAQALGQMLARGGLKVNGVATLPYNVFSPAATKLEYSFFVFSIGNSTSTSGPSLQNTLATFDKAAGTGSFNRGRFSNPVFDQKLQQAMSEFDESKRNALLEEATRIAFGDVGMIPLYWQKVHWAGKAGIGYVPSRGEDLRADLASIAK